MGLAEADRIARLSTASSRSTSSRKRRERRPGRRRKGSARPCSPKTCSTRPSSPATRRASSPPPTCILDLNGQDTARGLERRLRAYARPQILAIDEIGYLSYDAHAADLLFQVVSRRYEQKSIVVTTNLPSSNGTRSFRMPPAPSPSSTASRTTPRSFPLKASSYRKREAELAQKKRRAAP